MKYLMVALAGIIVVIAVIIIIATMRGRRQTLEAIDRVQTAVRGVTVQHPRPPGVAGLENTTVGDFRHTTLGMDGDLLSFIRVTMDFNRILADVERPDFHRAGNDIYGIYNDLYLYIEGKFSRTNHLAVVVENSDALEGYILPPGFADMRDFSLHVGRFLTHDDKFLEVHTEFGNLNIYSDFFYGRVGIAAGQQDVGDLQKLSLNFNFETYDETDEETFGETERPIITLQILDENGQNADTQNERRTAVVTIPLSLDFMTDDDDNLLYNAVEYIALEDAGTTERNRGVLPRSFVDDNYLYIFFNRTGRFQLIHIEHGDVHNIEQFLSNRLIELRYTQDEYGHRVVNRGDFFVALMDIHWVEDLFFDTTGTSPFIDVSDERMIAKIHVGRALGVLHGIEQEFTDNLFFPYNALRRSQLYALLSRYIEAFGVEVDYVFPVRHNVADQHVVSESVGTYWHEPLIELINMGFIPYKRVNDVNYLAPHDSVLLEEAQEILFKLITAGLLG